MATTTTSTIPAQTPATLPDGIEIFKAGKHVADSGDVYTFSEADVAGIAASYQPAMREAPLCVGHPADNKPAFGWVKNLQAVGGSLRMVTKDVVPQFAEMVNARLYKKRSAALYTPNHPSNPKPGSYYLRHVAFLGAQQPAVAGLADFAAADDAGLLIFSEAEGGGEPTPPQLLPQPSVDTKETTMTDKTKSAAPDAASITDAEARIKAADDARLAAEQAAKEANDKLAQFAEGQRKQREAECTQFAEGLIKQGIIPPAERAETIAGLCLFAEAKPVEFSEGSTTRKLDLLHWLKTRLESARPVVQFGEHAPASASASTVAVRLHKGASDEDVDKAAKAYMRQHKDMNYAEALQAVVSFTQ